jgi:ribosome assembly protein RRB1
MFLPHSPLLAETLTPATMSSLKRTRAADDGEGDPQSLKSGERPISNLPDGEDVGDFEDEFEDEFDSEDEIFEAGVDGRPDAEREAEEAEEGV